MKTRAIASLMTLQDLVKGVVATGNVAPLSDWLRDDTIDEAIHVLENHDPRALKVELEEVRAALTNLVNLKRHRDAFGKTEFYIENRGDAWEAASAALRYQNDERGFVPVETVKRLVTSGEARELNVLLGLEP